MAIHRGNRVLLSFLRTDSTTNSITKDKRRRLCDALVLGEDRFIFVLSMARVV